jgi:hypothetical protein
VTFDHLPLDGDTPTEFARRAREREQAARRRAVEARELAVKDTERGNAAHAGMHEREALHHEAAADEQARAAAAQEQRATGG